jgi:hypothetical protein
MDQLDDDEERMLIEGNDQIRKNISAMEEMGDDEMRDDDMGDVQEEEVESEQDKKGSRLKRRVCGQGHM